MSARSITVVTVALGALASGCGTVVGNPKKPPGPQNPPPPSVVYELPELQFEVPAGVLDTDTSLQLMAQEGDGGDRALLRDAGKRIDLAVRQVNALNARLNEIAEEEQGDGEVVRFKGKGPEGRLSGRIGPAAGEGYDYEAVACRDGRPFQRLRWAEGGGRIELTRDFAAAFGAEGDVTFALASRILLDRGTDETRIEIDSFGEETVAGADGKGLAERLVATRLASGETRFKATLDRYGARPAGDAFNGDAYLAARVLPPASAGAGLRGEFVAYSKAFPVLCRHGFDEDAADLWSPDAAGPRFCIGRPLDGPRFRSLAELRATAERLEEVGIVKAAELKAVEIEADAEACAGE